MRTHNESRGNRWTIRSSLILAAASSLMATVLASPANAEAVDSNHHLAGAQPKASGTVLFTGDFETGDQTQWKNHEYCPGGVTVVNDPVRSGNYAAKFLVHDTDTHENCPSVPTDSPRAQLISKDLFHNGDDLYIGFSTYFPADFPSPPSWFQVGEIYGAPYASSPAIGFDVENDAQGQPHLVLSRDQTHNNDTPWTAPTPVDKGTAWDDIVVHVKFSDDPSVGFVELWYNGVRQTFTDGSTRLYYATLVPGETWQQGTPNALYMNQYRAAKPMGTVTIYHDQALVGTTYDSVAPTGSRTVSPAERSLLH